MISRTVTGPINDSQGNPLASGTLVAKLLAPVADGTVFVSPEMASADIVSGALSLTLTAPGKYDFLVKNSTGDTVWHFQALLDDSAATDISLAELYITHTTNAQSCPNQIIVGTGAPEGVVTASIGHLFLRTDGGAGTTLYVKESGTDAFGWVAK
ncbi:MAG: hypothetical protein MJA29_10835 [Candidatus Omnitrophica bacterium]|nr:hypothetical protein [Candidatus Omnitrophota bacterium]